MAAKMSTVGFGTSGLRGKADGFTSGLVAAYVKAFLDTVCRGAAARQVAVGTDLRQSSPAIAAMVCTAVRQAGWESVYGGTVPTPALADYAIDRAIPAIMVTGSHIPPDYNGLKFYRPEGELLKADEGPVRDAAEPLLTDEAGGTGVGELPTVASDIAEHYFNRYRNAFAPDYLAGVRVGLFAHSAVGCDLLEAVLTGLGAQCHIFGRVEKFVAVDTEAVSREHLAVMRKVLQAGKLDAVVSTDGDGDRPLMLDESGTQVSGDILGILTARMLGAKTVVTPLTSTSAIELSGAFDTVIRTRIGSPYVVAAMGDADQQAVVGFEANGGFFVQSPFALDAGNLAALPTRDAILPLVAVLGEHRRTDMPVSQLVADLPQRVMKADRVKQVAPDTGKTFVTQLAGSEKVRATIDPALRDPVEIDTTDGTRLVLGGDIVVHFRQSGNAPELRCYVETGSAAETGKLLDRMMEGLARHIGTSDR